MNEPSTLQFWWQSLLSDPTPTFRDPQDRWLEWLIHWGTSPAVRYHVPTTGWAWYETCNERRAEVQESRYDE
jgi:hypothetical protein